METAEAPGKLFLNHCYYAQLESHELYHMKVLSVHTEKCLVGFTIRWLIQLHDLVSYKATTYLVVVTNSDSCSDLGNITI